MSNGSSPLTLHIDPRTAAADALEEKRRAASAMVAAWRWKSALPEGFPLIVCIIGGTGTGKSTLFNSLAGRVISEAGARRPCTTRAVILAPTVICADPANRPLPEVNPGDDAIVVHADDPLYLGPILVDTPDFDSVEIENRAVAENYFVLSDVVVFVTSQEKYGDLTGRRMLDRAREWGKKSLFILNKVSSDAVPEDFREALIRGGEADDLVSIERFTPPPEIISGLVDRFGASGAIFRDQGGDREASIRRAELKNLQREAAAAVDALTAAASEEHERISGVVSRIREIAAEVSAELQGRLDRVVSDDLESRIRYRLQALLRKYDILFVPRMMVRNALRAVFASVIDLFGGRGLTVSPSGDAKESRIEDVQATLAAARLKPLEAAIALLNQRIAEELAQDPARKDLREIALSSVPRWDATKIRALYEESFPGMEALLEEEFDRLRRGLSWGDELKLYGSYGLWALLLITAEIVVGGGFTLLDALLNTVIVPLIPKWLLDLKILDVLHDIGKRVDAAHRHALAAILDRQAGLYVSEFSGLVPDEGALENLAELRAAIENA